jgi:hypothetical protein
MAVTAKPYGPFLFALGKGQINFTATTVRFLLAKPGYTPNFLTEASLEDMEANGFVEVNDEGFSGGYMMGGWTFQNVTWTYDTATGIARLAAGLVDLAATTATFRHGIVMVDSYDGPVGCLDFGSNQVHEEGDGGFTYAFPDGILNIIAG